MYSDLLMKLFLGVTFIFTDSYVDNYNNFIDCENINGNYIVEVKTINVCKNSDNKKETLIHELGHHFFFNYITTEEKDYFINNFCYGLTKTGCYEDFAIEFSNIIYSNLYDDKLFSMLKTESVEYIEELILKYNK